MNRYIIIVVFGLLLLSCGSNKGIITKKKNAPQRTERVLTTKPTANSKKETNASSDEQVVIPNTNKTFNNSTEAYIHTYNGIAKEEMRRYKIPASITLAQGILESASGQGRLAVEGNNHFGIKCHNWTGDKIYHDDDINQECFRKYRRAEESFEDHSTFLTTRSRYADLFKHDEDDYESWAKGLRAAGYATDKKYPEKLISLIERFQLYKYDEDVLGNSNNSRKRPSEINTQLMVHEVINGDTMYSISKRYNVTIQKLQELNGMKTYDLKLGQKLIIKSN